MSLLIKLDMVRESFRLTVCTTIALEGVTAIYGASGAGKTTLLRVIAGLDHVPEAGIRFGEEDWQRDGSFVPPHKRGIGYVFQDGRLFPHLSVRGNLEYAWQRRRNDAGPSVAQVCAWLELEPLLERSAATLSGGQQQRVAIGRALVSAPRLILMDEPLGSLDEVRRRRILPLLENLHREAGIPILYVSHNIDEITRLADRLIVLENGTLKAQGNLLDLCTQLDLAMSHEENAAAIVTGAVRGHNNHYGLTRLDLDANTPLWLARNTATKDTVLRVRIPARDVSVALSPQRDSSILNILPCRIDAIENTSDARVLLRLRVADQYLLSRITHRSLDRLKLRAGQTVYAQIKSVALLSEPDAPAPR